MDLLRFITAGSVDDGKSTLIGRLLYDSKSILSDQLEAIERSTKNMEDGGVDLALLTDGLRAEREQGITIDVAYRYFTSPLRKFIIADAPGHVQYTRNMITGASTADAIIVLIDARQGVVEQTRRHSIIASLLKVKHVVVAINKMDLVGFDQSRYEEILDAYRLIASQLELDQVHFIPISAKLGDNVVDSSSNMPWFDGEPLLAMLERLEVNDSIDLDKGRFQVQFVIRPQTEALHDYRGYAGKISSGIYRVGDPVIILPLNQSSFISKIEVAGIEVEEAFAPQGVVIHLKDDIDVSRGDMIVPADQLPRVSADHEVVLSWLDDKPLQMGGKYLLQQGSRIVRCIVKQIHHRIDVNSLEKIPVEGEVILNEVVKATIKTSSPLVTDAYAENKSNGSAILVDETSNATVAALLFL